MLTLSTADISELEQSFGCQISCSSCIRTIFIVSDSDIVAELSAAGWQQAINDNEFFPCVCPRCVAELKENELEQGEA
ncbi:hypothetical protein ACRN94_19800 [Shewanella baltica]|uniref:Uncharacterized protein n=1 Tax=Shewanella oncorhynchi TaxID=2726434 RepID=A0ABX1KPC9_9GAMM|nr:hypothetical protein [Shewanella oncorhynchi]NLQ23504.1 hypothetical protein [Shewanella oncorhynchi]